MLFLPILSGLSPVLYFGIRCDCDIECIDIERGASTNIGDDCFISLRHLRVYIGRHSDYNTHNLAQYQPAEYSNYQYPNHQYPNHQYSNYQQGLDRSPTQCRPR